MRLWSPTLASSTDRCWPISAGAGGLQCVDIWPSFLLMMLLLTSECVDGASETPRFAWATPSVAFRVLSLPDGRQGQVRRLRLVPPLSLGLVAYSCVKGKGFAHHPHPFGAHPTGSAPLRPAVMPLTQLPAIERFLQR